MTRSVSPRVWRSVLVSSTALYGSWKMYWISASSPGLLFRYVPKRRLPSRSTSPESGHWLPQMIRARVVFPPPVSPAGGGDGASECGCPAADGACGFAARGVSPVWSGGSGDLRRGVRPLFRGDLPAVPPECGIEGRETEPPRREDFAAGRFHVKRGVICPRPQTPPQSPEREAG